MVMSKKDYVAIAKIITETTRIDDAKSLIKEDFVFCLQNYFKKDNPKFNEKKFLEACSAHP